MQEVLMDKVVVNMSVGSDPDEMKKAVQIIKLVTGKKPVNTLCQSKLPDWGLRPNTNWLCNSKRNDAIEFLKAIQAKAENKTKSFDKEGNFDLSWIHWFTRSKIHDPKLE